MKKNIKCKIVIPIILIGLFFTQINLYANGLGTEFEGLSTTNFKSFLDEGTFNQLSEQWSESRGLTDKKGNDINGFSTSQHMTDVNNASLQHNETITLIQEDNHNTGIHIPTDLTSILSSVIDFYSKSDLVTSGMISDLSSVTVKYKIDDDTSYKAHMSYSDASELAEKFSNSNSSGTLSISVLDTESNIRVTDSFTNKAQDISMFTDMNTLQSYATEHPESSAIQMFDGDILIREDIVQKFAPSDDALNLFNGITVLDSNNNPQDFMVADESLLTMITENASTTAANEDLANQLKEKQDAETKENNINSAAQGIINSSSALKAGQVIGQGIIALLK